MALLPWSEALDIPYSLRGSVMYFSPKSQLSGRRRSGSERLIDGQLLRTLTALTGSCFHFFFFHFSLNLYTSRQKGYTFFSRREV